ncbi:MAG: carboxymuconolactone decarboxylase family protein [Candidatus Rokubacteria bacterium]|nr:carboxymuconolactone decarboxylase family protein [Candidatus Rokubacteria bacterium]
MKIEPIDNTRASEAVRAVYDGLEKRTGRVSTFVKMLAHKPDVLRTFLEFYPQIVGPGKLSPKLKELAYLRTSIYNGCAY